MITLVPAALALSPQGHVHLESHPPDESAIDERILARIRRAFGHGAGAGILHLGTAELDTALPRRSAIGATSDGSSPPVRAR